MSAKANLDLITITATIEETGLFDVDTGQNVPFPDRGGAADLRAGIMQKRASLL